MVSLHPTKPGCLVIPEQVPRHLQSSYSGMRQGSPRVYDVPWQPYKNTVPNSTPRSVRSVQWTEICAAHISDGKKTNLTPFSTAKMSSTLISSSWPLGQIIDAHYIIQILEGRDIFLISMVCMICMICIICTIQILHNISQRQVRIQMIQMIQVIYPTQIVIYLSDVWRSLSRKDVDVLPLQRGLA